MCGQAVVEAHHVVVGHHRAVAQRAPSPPLGVLLAGLVVVGRLPSMEGPDGGGVQLSRVPAGAPEAAEAERGSRPPQLHAAAAATAALAAAVEPAALQRRRLPPGGWLAQGLCGLRGLPGRLLTLSSESSTSRHPRPAGSANQRHLPPASLVLHPTHAVICLLCPFGFYGIRRKSHQARLRRIPCQLLDTVCQHLDEPCLGRPAAADAADASRVEKEAVAGNGIAREDFHPVEEDSFSSRGGRNGTHPRGSCIHWRRMKLARAASDGAGGGMFPSFSASPVPSTEIRETESAQIGSLTFDALLLRVAEE